jgi:hypothetical protein
MLGRISYYFVKPFEQGFKIALFRKVLYGFLILNTISLLPIAYELFSYNGIVGSGGWNTDLPWYTQGTKAILNALSHPINSQYSWIFWFFIFGQLFFLVLGILGKWRRLSSIMIYFFTVNLFLKGYLMFTGGEALVNILLFYLIFMDEKVDEAARNYQLQNILNNTFYIVIIVQICVLYFFSTFYKLIDPHWWSGEAMMYISRVDAFSGNTLKFLFADHPNVSKAASWMVLFYQGAFPILVWIKKVKIPLLITGVIFHLSISIFMGIFTFGIVMIITYLLFLNDHHIQWIGQKLRVKYS